MEQVKTELHELLRDNNELLGRMIEYQIETYRDLKRLQEEYRMQCTANTHLGELNVQLNERLKTITDYVRREQYCPREDLMSMLGIDGEDDAADDITADGLPFGPTEFTAIPTHFVRKNDGDALERAAKEEAV